MAPRETRVEALSFDRLSGPASQRLHESTLADDRARTARAAATRRTQATPPPTQDSSAVGQGRSVSLMDDADVERQAQAMRSAAESGVPFCKLCPKAS